MAEPTRLVSEFRAMRPQMVFHFESFSEAEDIFFKPLEVLHHAAIALTEDIAMFQAMGYHKTPTAAGEEFLRSLAYYVEVLVQDSIVKLESELEAYTCTPALTIKSQNHSIGLMLAKATAAVHELSKIKRDLLLNAGWKITWKIPSAGEMVPTASPYQLLYQMRCIEKLSAAPAGDEITRTFLSLQKQAYLSLPKLPPGIVRITSDVACGRPTMIFVAGTLDMSRIVFGANETAWDALKAISAITRMARDTRLQHYVPPAMAAFQALRRKEKEALHKLQEDSGGTPDREDLLWRARSGAIEDMRSEDSFLGGENEMGIALRPPTWSINQGCYLCQGMMGYQSPKSWNANQRRKYILKFD